MPLWQRWGTWETGTEDRIEVWAPENGSLCRRLLGRKSPRRSVLAGQNGRKTNRTREGKSAQTIFVELHYAPLIRRFCFATERRGLRRTYGMCPPGRFRRDLP